MYAIFSILASIVQPWYFVCIDSQKFHFPDDCRKFIFEKILFKFLENDILCIRADEISYSSAVVDDPVCGQSFVGTHYSVRVHSYFSAVFSLNTASQNCNKIFEKNLLLYRLNLSNILRKNEINFAIKSCHKILKNCKVFIFINKKRPFLSVF